MQELRDYQQHALDEVLCAYRDGARRVLLVLPTGGGKTTVFSRLVGDVVSSSSTARAVILAHRRELVTQAAKRLREFQIDHGLIVAGEAPKPYARVQVASVQTLVRRQAPPAGLVVADEAHLSTADTWARILASYPNSRILGVTATPWRLSGKPLAGAYDLVVVAATPGELRAEGWLCPYTGYTYRSIDLSGVKKVGDDYDQGAAGKAASAIVGDVVKQWQTHASHLSTVVFAATVESSKELTAEFIAAGVRAEHLDGSTPIERRKAIIARVDAGVTQVLCNVGVAVEGLDVPRLKCCVLVRPTMSTSRAMQMVGRVFRPWQGVTARIHDHAFVIPTHGLPDDDRDYSLNAKAEKPPALTTCEKCLALYRGDACPACGGQNEKRIVERTGPEVLEDVEQVAFDQRTIRSVSVRWDTGRRDKAIEGVFVEQVEETTQYGKRAVWLVEQHGRTVTTRYALPGTKLLDRKMKVVRSGDKVRVTYLGERIVGQVEGAFEDTGRTYKEFKVEIDRADDDMEALPDVA